MKRRIASRTILRLKLANELVKARFMGDVSARKLKNPLAAQGVFQGLFAHGTFATNERALPAIPASVGGGRHCGGSSNGLGCTFG